MHVCNSVDRATVDGPVERKNVVDVVGRDCIRCRGGSCCTGGSLRGMRFLRRCNELSVVTSGGGEVDGAAFRSGATASLRNPGLGR